MIYYKNKFEIKIDELKDNIFSKFGYEIMDAKKIELELSANIGYYKSYLDDLCFDIYCQTGCTTNYHIKSYNDKNLNLNMCEFELRIYR